MAPIRPVSLALVIGGMLVYSIVALWAVRSRAPDAGSAAAPVPVAEPSRSAAQTTALSSGDYPLPPAAPAATPSAAPAPTPSPAPSPAIAIPPADLPQPSSLAADLPTPPGFDVVRVQPDGSLVVAGRAPAGTTVELMRGDQVHARAMLDASGQFVLTDPPLPPGAHNLALRIALPDGRTVLSRQTVTVDIAPGGSRPPVVTLATPDRPTVVLSLPEGTSAPAATPTPSGPASPTSASPAPAAAVPSAPAPSLSIRSVEADEAGRFFVTGRAEPGSTVRLYLNDAYLAEARPEAGGDFAFTVNRGVTAGAYRVRIDAVDAAGAVKARAEAPFTMPAPAAAGASASPNAPVTNASVASAPAPAGSGVPAQMPAAQTTPAGPGTTIVPAVRTATVTRGDSLWRISRQLYGAGIRYTQIYEANRGQIRDPDLIYPGQVLVAPAP